MANERTGYVSSGFSDGYFVATYLNGTYQNSKSFPTATEAGAYVDAWVKGGEKPAEVPPPPLAEPAPGRTLREEAALIVWKTYHSIQPDSRLWEDLEDEADELGKTKAEMLADWTVVYADALVARLKGE